MLPQQSHEFLRLINEILMKKVKLLLKWIFGLSIILIILLSIISLFYIKSEIKQLSGDRTLGKADFDVFGEKGQNSSNAKVAFYVNKKKNK